MIPSPPLDLGGRSRLGQLLVDRRTINSSQLDEALQEQQRSGEFLGAILVTKGWASEEQVARALSEQLGLAYVDLASHPVEPQALDLIPEDLCRTYQAIPLFAMEDSLTLAMANPLDANAIEVLQRSSKRHIHPVFAIPSAIRRALDEGVRQPRGASGPSEWPGANVVGLPMTDAPDTGSTDPLAKLKAVASLAPVVELVDELITEAVAAEASDIHLEPNETQFCCRFRVDGILHERSALPKEYQAAIISRIKIFANMDIAERRLPQDGRAQKIVAGHPVDLRVSTFPTIHGENVVIRILDPRRALLTLEELGFSESIFQQFGALIAKPHGILLVTGPTGSGKTTTLYGALNRLDQTKQNIMTLEDPVEYELPNVRQSQVNLKAGLTFATGLRSMLRQDPDIILIGEIRDKETADIAIHASLTGHLVFSTLHTNDASSAVSRLVDMGVEPFLVATSLIGVLAQRLVRTLCASCKASYQPPAELLERLGVTPQSVSGLFREVGCARCRQTGYHGRIGLYELLIPNKPIQELITKKVPAGAIKTEAVRAGMVTLRQDGIEKLRRGMTSLAEVIRVVTWEE